MKVGELLKLLETTDPSCNLKVKCKLKGLELAAPLQHSYILDVELGEIELILDLGEIQ